MIRLSDTQLESMVVFLTWHGWTPLGEGWWEDPATLEAETTFSAYNLARARFTTIKNDLPQGKRGRVNTETPGIVAPDANHGATTL